MKFIETVGKNIDDALEKALSELKTTKENVVVDVLEEGSKGFLNLFGVKPCKIKVMIKESIEDNIIPQIKVDKNDGEIFLEDILKTMNISAEVSCKELEDSTLYDISGENMGTIIGYRGETLDSIQYLLSLFLNKDHNKPYRRVILDTENYREKRKDTLKRVANKTADKVVKSRRSYRLEPMNPYERRVIHSELQNRQDVETHSEGQEPYRRVVVNIKK